METLGKGIALERRQHTRYGVRARVNVRWQDEGILYRGSGVTRDISSNGMFIYSESLPLAKADVEVEVSFPSGGESTLRMRARALVIRVERETDPETHKGFAVLNRSYELHNELL